MPHAYRERWDYTVSVPIHNQGTRGGMKIIAVQTGLSPRSVLGGSITDRKFLTQLADHGVEVHILVEAGEPVVEHPNFRVHYWRRGLLKKLPYSGNVGVYFYLRRLLRHMDGVDWIRFNSPYAVGIGTVLAAGDYRIWGSWLHLEDRPFWRWVDSWLPKRCDLITCLSRDTRSDLVERCPAADHPRNIVVPIGIETDRFSPDPSSRVYMRQKLGFPNDAVVIMFAGVLQPRKGISDLLRTWSLLGSRPDIRLLIIGRYIPGYEGLYFAVQDLAKRDPRVVYIERVPHEEMHMYLQAADIFFFPTRLEGFGIVVGEAMACALPVVTTEAKGVREVVLQGETALVVPVGDTHSMAEALFKLIEDKDLRTRLGTAGRERIAKDFGWSTIVSKLMEALLSM